MLRLCARVRLLCVCVRDRMNNRANVANRCAPSSTRRLSVCAFCVRVALIADLLSTCAECIYRYFRGHSLCCVDNESSHHRRGQQTIQNTECTRAVHCISCSSTNALFNDSRQTKNTHLLSALFCSYEDIPKRAHNLHASGAWTKRLISL